MERKEKLYIIATDVVGLALNLEEDPAITVEDLKSAYVDAETKFKAEAAANFDRKVSMISGKLFSTTASSDAVTAAKAAAYDRVKAVAHQFVQSWSNGQLGINDENGLTQHLQLMENSYATNSSNTFGLTPAQYIQQLQQLVQAKDAEIANLQQQLQQAQQICKQQEQKITDLAAQIPATTPTK